MWPLVDTIPRIPNGSYPYTSAWWSYRHLRFLDWITSSSWLLSFLKGSPRLPFLSSSSQSPISKHSPLKYFWNVAFLPWSDLSLSYHLSLLYLNPSTSPPSLVTVSPIPVCRAGLIPGSHIHAILISTTDHFVPIPDQGDPNPQRSCVLPQ